MSRKEAQERRAEILDISMELFRTKGFDNTSISDILSEVGIARGTLYYHFKSKEEIMDSIIDRQSREMINRAKEIANTKSLPVLVRFFSTLQSLNFNNSDDRAVVEFIHRPQNALINEKNHRVIMNEIPPILLGIVEDGIKEGIFKMDYPYEAIEMVINYAISVFGHEFSILTEELKQKKIVAFIRNIEVLFGAKKGTFDEITKMIIGVD